MYLTMDEYEDLTDKTLDEYTYMRSEYKARTMINNLTYNRLTTESPVRESVKMLMIELIELFQNASTNAAQSDAGVSSMSNDGVSMSFQNGLALEQSVRGKAEILIRSYLANETTDKGVPLLSRWVYA